MAVKSSGSNLSFNTDIVGEFGGSTPHNLSEYKRGGSLVPNGPSANAEIPTSNADIQFSDFYGSVAQQNTQLTSSATINGYSNRKQITASSFISSGDILTIPSNFYVWSDSTSVAALIIDIPCTIVNNGFIIGKGGRGGYKSNSSSTRNGEAGGPAIKINSGVTGVTITNNSGAYIAGGGGGGGSADHDGRYAGGGGGAGGGAGGGLFNNSGSTAGGILGAEGADGNGGPYGTDGYQGPANGGGAGGGAGAYDEVGSDQTNGTGGGGGRILGSGATGGAGGTAYNFGGAGGANGDAGQDGGGAGGGGGWGASGGDGNWNNGGNGGAGGAAISDSGVTYTLTNNGTVYGAT